MTMSDMFRKYGVRSGGGHKLHYANLAPEGAGHS
jgi:hypothetical protein